MSRTRVRVAVCVLFLIIYLLIPFSVEAQVRKGINKRPLIKKAVLRIPSPKKRDLHTAIVNKIGIRYRWAGTGNKGYDCSGLVWRVFTEIGTDMERTSARELWKSLPKATKAEEIQFGTLVFFNGLRHVGIVNDENTFYHASRSKGVGLSDFNKYWVSRITGYRKIPMQKITMNYCMCE